MRTVTLKIDGMDWIEYPILAGDIPDTIGIDVKTETGIIIFVFIHIDTNKDVYELHRICD